MHINRTQNSVRSNFKDYCTNMYQTEVYPWNGYGDVTTVGTFQQQKGLADMTFLYEVIIISKEEEILLETKVTAKDEENAKFKAEVYDTLRKNRLTPDDVTIITRQLGSVKTNS
ncbi:hypothetical protein EBB07_28835 [Paenibacillaceae bacterium]|nr:hypothetical protein EBB07_28835 [Paenibacillaceae bacterium]